METKLFQEIIKGKIYFAHFISQFEFKNEYLNILFLLSIYDEKLLNRKDMQEDVKILNELDELSNFYSEPKLKYILKKKKETDFEQEEKENELETAIIKSIKLKNWKNALNILMEYIITLWNFNYNSKCNLKILQILIKVCHDTIESLQEFLKTISIPCHDVINKNDSKHKFINIHNLNLILFSTHMILGLFHYGIKKDDKKNIYRNEFIVNHENESKYEMEFKNQITKMSSILLNITNKLLLNEQQKSKYFELVLELCWIFLILEQNNFIFTEEQKKQIDFMKSHCLQTVTRKYGNKKRKRESKVKFKISYFSTMHKKYHEAFLALMVLKNLKF